MMDLTTKERAYIGKKVSESAENGSRGTIPFGIDKHIQEWGELEPRFEIIVEGCKEAN